MSRDQTPYSHDFRTEPAKQVLSGLEPEERNRELEPTAQSIRSSEAAADAAECRHALSLEC